MRKFYTLFLLAVLPILGFSQTFDFTNADGGWTGVQSSLTLNPTSITLDFVTNQAPKLRHATAGVTNPVTNGVIAITLKNNSSVNEIRFVYEKLATGSGTAGVVIPITPNTNYYKTYVIDLSGDAEWDNNAAGGTQNALDFAFREPGGANGNVNVDSDGSIEIDKVEFIPNRPEKTVYTFDNDGDPEGWSDLVDATTSVSGGSLIVTPTAGAIGKVTNSTFSVNATNNAYMHIVYKNLSPTNNQLRIQFRSTFDNYTSFNGATITISQSMAGFETLDIDLQTLKPTEWTGNAQDLQVALRNSANAGNVANADGNLEISQIVFDNNITLSTNRQELNASNFSFYPNPANNVVYFKGNSQITKAAIYDITGKQVFETSRISNNSLDISKLKSGLYLLSVTDKNDIY
ncbi:T9SS type A sorting domain-containing protein [Siansivirga zeaxanthinifaciens]|uniref:Secretion system C-terminal sorting domain-containing protein n=1 Tax=Siansivirga zeaxanthinifaciens CC-SAMT-1 TaxID=1454006 RepID=A0A0C5WPP5_9FLAO|nr:T9SS type A sorting domain-containing protein [Siansivirga zeaxanthinifaciens]AJR04905.1 hypothetical protein AW14_08990 [Siansivirga zeaxanthinifaciens CC-SAMT-1]